MGETGWNATRFV